MAIIWSSTVTYEILTLTIWTLVAVSPKTLGDATVFHLLFLTSLCLRSNKAFCCTLCMQARLYQLIEAAGITYISIGHRSTLYKYHKKVLHISTANTTSNQRNWSFKNVGEDSIYDFSKQQLWANNFSFSTWYYCLDAYSHRSPDCSLSNFSKISSWLCCMVNGLHMECRQILRITPHECLNVILSTFRGLFPCICNSWVGIEWNHLLRMSRS